MRSDICKHEPILTIAGFIFCALTVFLPSTDALSVLLSVGMFTLQLLIFFVVRTYKPLEIHGFKLLLLLVSYLILGITNDIVIDNLFLVAYSTILVTFVVLLYGLLILDEW